MVRRKKQKGAELLQEWLKCVIQAVDPWISSKNIDRGALWFPEINDQLANTVTGIVCLTKENKDKPWILFESGALAKGLSSSRVITLLIDLQTHDLEPPLSQFNHTVPNHEGLLLLVKTINSTLKENRLSEEILVKSFEHWWPEFNKQFTEIMTSIEEVMIKERPQSEMVNEILDIVRGFDKQLREANQLSSDDFFQDGVTEKIRLYTLMHEVKKLVNQGLMDVEIQERLSGLGYSRKEVRRAINESMM